MSEETSTHVKFDFRFYIIWFVKKKLLLFMYIISILQSHYVAEKVDKGIPNNRFIHHKDDYYLDIRSIFIFEGLFFRHCSSILFKHCIDIEFYHDFE